jgi:homogentisate 1,2-dioxygenase
MFHPDAGPQRYLVIESASSIETPKRYRNEYGQLLEHSPFTERDIRKPERLETFTDNGTYEVRIKARDQITAYEFDFHPLDVVGWDGYLYPYIFNIEDFEPITGRIHMPPPRTSASRGATSSSARSSRGSTTITRTPCPCRTTIRTSTRTRCSIT